MIDAMAPVNLLAAKAISSNSATVFCGFEGTYRIPKRYPECSSMRGKGSLAYPEPFRR
jgi:hypothetical protein